MYNTEVKTIHSELINNGLCLSQSRNGTDKEFPKKYISEVYQPIIGPLYNKPLIFVEIGVRTGASAHLWASYFNNLDLYIIDDGRDVVEQNSAWLKGQNITYLHADAYVNSTISKLPSSINIIVDDGLHSLNSQIFVAKNYTNLLAPDGLLFIEDIQRGRRDCDQIISGLPKSFKGCVRVFDLRKLTSQSDALILLIHNCTGICTLPTSVKNELTKPLALLRFIKYEGFKHNLFRIRNIRKLRQRIMKF
jgi:hypothetical protein